MANIMHRIEVKSSANEAYRALTTLEGLAGWWTNDTRGDASVGGTIHFRFGNQGGCDVKVVELEPARRVAWRVVAGPSDWLDTTIGFELQQNGDDTAVLFKHQGWKEEAEFLSHCSTKWAMYLMSAKALLETGKGAPFPNDVHISSKAD